MKSQIAWIAWAALIVSAAAAQTPQRVVSPQVLPDQRVVFRLRAPQAREVTITGDFWLQQSRTEKLIKGDLGIWSLTTEPLRSDYYSYSFSVDGIRTQDPVNVLTKPGNNSTESMFRVPGAQASLLDAGPVPHGEVREVFYPSAVIGGTRRMHIYFPPDYETGKQRYPVVYLFHGGGEDDRGWVAIGRVNFLLDNLIAQGKAKPMIVVMPSIVALDPAVAEEQVDENDRLVRKSLVDEVIPYVETHYRALPDSAHRAAGGLGVGRFSTPDILWPIFDKFDYIVHTSGGVNPEWMPLLEKKYPGVLDNPANIRRMKFFIGNGTNDHGLPAAQSIADELKKRGYKATLYVTDDIHGWPGFRRYFQGFAEMAFR
jgi:enterochelin esterase family protein